MLLECLNIVFSCLHDAIQRHCKLQEQTLMAETPITISCDQLTELMRPEIQQSLKAGRCWIMHKGFQATPPCLLSQVSYRCCWPLQAHQEGQADTSQAPDDTTVSTSMKLPADTWLWTTP